MAGFLIACEQAYSARIRAVNTTNVVSSVRLSETNFC